MKSIITLGQALVVFVTGMGPLVYYSLSDIALADSRKYKIEYEFKNLTGEGEGEVTQEDGKSKRYQGMPNEKVCMGKNKQYESVYDLRFKDGSSIEANGWRAGGSGVSIKEPFEVIEKKSYVEDEQWKGKMQNNSTKLSEEIKKNLRLVIYKDTEGRFGAILIGNVKDTWQEYKNDNLDDKVDNAKLSEFGEFIKKGDFAVRRSVKGVWSKLINGDNGIRSCEQSSVKLGNPLYKNYGVLVKEWSEDIKSQKELKKHKEGIFEGITVLDWVDFGFKSVIREEGPWIQSGSKAVGRWDYWKIKDSKKPLQVIIGKLEDIAISEDGISDGKGNKILWSEQFKPTKWKVSLVK